MTKKKKEVDPITFVINRARYYELQAVVGRAQARLVDCEEEINAQREILAESEAKVRAFNRYLGRAEDDFSIKPGDDA